MHCEQCHRPLKPIVAVDIDGTLAEYHEHFVHFAENYFYRCLVSETQGYTYDGSTTLHQYLGLSIEEYRQCKLAYRQGGNKRLLPIHDGAEALVNDVPAAEVWLTTTRPYNRFDSTDPDTREWMRRWDIKCEHLLYDDDKYAKLIEIVGRDRIACVVDDLPENCLRAQQLGLRAILVARPHNAAFLRGYNRHAKDAISVSSNLRDAKVAVDYWVDRWERQHATS